jgi:hypothetical protein
MARVDPTPTPCGKIVRLQETNLSMRNRNDTVQPSRADFNNQQKKDPF